jgi:hypothetical protein
MSDAVEKIKALTDHTYGTWNRQSGWKTLQRGWKAVHRFFFTIDVLEPGAQEQGHYRGDCQAG